MVWYPIFNIQMANLIKISFFLSVLPSLFAAVESDLSTERVCFKASLRPWHQTALIVSVYQGQFW